MWDWEKLGAAWGAAGSRPALLLGFPHTSRCQFGQGQAKPWMKAAGSRGWTHPEDVGRELVQVLRALRNGLVSPHGFFFLQREERKKNPPCVKTEGMKEQSKNIL